MPQTDNSSANLNPLPPPVRYPSAADTLVSVAPMMDRTDRHFRYLVRLLAPDVRLYTEMLTASAVINGDMDRLLSYDPVEHPLALQLGGNDADELAQAAAAAEARHYDEINLNIGCPSDRVQSGRFGACLMADPEKVANCVAAILQAVDLPVSVKTRIGIDDHDDFEFLENFVAAVSEAGCRMFIVHARKALLDGLSTKQNLTVPPLRYPNVYRLKNRFPDLRIVVNGGVRDTESIRTHLDHVDGVMIGREAYRNPYWLTELQVRHLNPAFERKWDPPSRRQVIEAMARYAKQELERGTTMQQITRHMLGLCSGRPRARAWRRFLSERSAGCGPGSQLLLDSLDLVEGNAA